MVTWKRGMWKEDLARRRAEREWKKASVHHQPVAFLFCTNSGTREIDVMCIDVKLPGTTEEPEMKISKVTSFFHEDGKGLMSMGYTVHNDKIYVVGGGFSMEDEARLYTRKCFIGDIYRDDYEGGKIKLGGWKRGPRLEGGKPNPMVVAVDGKIYALAANNLTSVAREYTYPPFEVMDTRMTPMYWRTLPYPPFSSLYSKPIDVFIDGFTVAGDTIYVLLRYDGKGPSDPMLYSYDTKKEVWATHDEDDDDEDDEENEDDEKKKDVDKEENEDDVENEGDEKENDEKKKDVDKEENEDDVEKEENEDDVENEGDEKENDEKKKDVDKELNGNDFRLPNILKYYKWENQTHIVNDVLYCNLKDIALPQTKLYAYNLKGDPDITLATRVLCPRCEEDEYLSITIDNPRCIPIHGLNHITDLFSEGKDSSGGMVHLRGNLFCLFGICCKVPAGERPSRACRAVMFSLHSEEPSAEDDLEFLLETPPQPTIEQQCLYARVVCETKFPIAHHTIGELVHWCKTLM